MKYFQDVLTLTATATTLFDDGDLISFGDGKIITEDQPVKGIAKHPATVLGLDIGVVAIGVGPVIAKGAIAKGAKLTTAAGGGVKVAAANAVNVFAIALNDAADGQIVQILIR